MPGFSPIAMRMLICPGLMPRLAELGEEGLEDLKLREPQHEAGKLGERTEVDGRLRSRRVGGAAWSVAGRVKCAARSR